MKANENKVIQSQSNLLEEKKQVSMKSWLNQHRSPILSDPL